jgi:hypothetical protein
VKQKHLLILSIFLLIVCVVQQVKIQSSDTAPQESVALPEQTWNVELLDQNLEPPAGAKSCLPDRNTLDLSGASINPDGFEARIWLDLSEVDTSAWAKDAVLSDSSITSRERLVVWISDYYAHKIAGAIEGAKVVPSFERTSSVEKGSLHSIRLIEHPHGHIAVSSGYRMTDAGELSDQIKVNVISRNSIAKMKGHYRSAPAGPMPK